MRSRSNLPQLRGGIHQREGDVRPAQGCRRTGENRGTGRDQTVRGCLITSQAFAIDRLRLASESFPAPPERPHAHARGPAWPDEGAPDGRQAMIGPQTAYHQLSNSSNQDIQNILRGPHLAPFYILQDYVHLLHPAPYLICKLPILFRA